MILSRYMCSADVDLSLFLGTTRMDSSAAAFVATSTAVQVDTTLSDHLFQLLDDSAYDWLYIHMFDNRIEEAVDSDTLGTAQKVAMRFNNREHLGDFLEFISKKSEIVYDSPYGSRTFI